MVCNCDCKTKIRANSSEQLLKALSEKRYRFSVPAKFQEVKELVVQHPILKFYNQEEEATFKFDASEKGEGDS